ncbi:hypothetical protein [Mycobacterium parascrofulaceum]|uniref:hypothetical protein n=1 Tax=Mycobacterium parascrofulaceum TaxID=240125 RepID=UPI0012F4C082|nr:hypothetical protein [Mycobacterium parascrofulaceum]
MRHGLRDMSRYDKRLLVGGVCGIGFALAAAVLLQHIPWTNLRPHLDVKWWATTLQVVGAAVAFAGFWNAYVRAKHDVTVPVWLWEHALLRAWRQVQRFVAWAKRMYWKLFHIVPPTQHIILSPMTGTMAATMGTPTVTMFGRVGVNPDSPLEQQMRQVAALAEDAIDRVWALERDELPRIERRIDAAQAGAEQLAAETLAQLRDEITDLRRLTNQAQVLDVRWAIGGLGITVVGIFLGYWA